jgi:hypothetical protein
MKTMNEFMLQFINQYGAQILFAILSAAATALGAWVGKVYKQKVNDDIKRKVVKTCCTAVEMLYKDLKGEEKYKRACEGISEMLAEKGITITALEMQMLIEEVCYDFAHAVREEITKTENPVAGFVGGEVEAVVPA